MRLLLDTHLILWWQGKSARLPQAAYSLIMATQGPVYVSHGSLWEMAIKINQGKLRVDLPLFCRQVVSDGFSWLAIDTTHLQRVAALPLFDDHKDPFDRLLIAQSLSEPMILLTADIRLARYGSTVNVVAA
jgi:PIN domain nuclease of toxin-antitoxin system